MFTAADASRILSVAVTAFGSGEPACTDGLDLTAIGLIPGERIPTTRCELSGSPRSPGLSSSSHQNDEKAAAGNLGVMIPAEAPRREALSELNERLSTSPLRKRWWSSLWLLTRSGQGPVEFDLPQASGDSFVLFDSEAAAAWITVGQARAYHRCESRVLVVPECAGGPCVLEGRFTRALYVYRRCGRSEWPR